MKRLVSALALCLLAACGSAAPVATHGSGVQGTVTVGPTCPVERINSPCPPRPLSVTVLAQDSSRREVARVRSDSDGHFKLDLAPGKYTLIGEAPGAGPLPRPVSQAVTVPSGAYTVVALQFDSGIR